MKFLVCLFLLNTFLYSQISVDDRKELRKNIKWLSEFDIKYSKLWTPPDSSKPVRFDCSGTVQYLFQRSLNLILPRDSYSQYLFFKQKEKFEEAPLELDESVDIDELRKKLKFGDVLFWINSYNMPPGREPPISHVMIYVGKTKTGLMRMAGSNTWGAGFFTKSGGPDVYDFDPNQKIGCVRERENDRKSKCILESKFIGFGRFIKN
jgi:hypothetical protein